MTSRNKLSSCAGFTLLEMLVVIAVMGIAMVLLADAGPPKNHWLETQAAAQQVAQAMRDARGRAIAQGQTETLVLPPLPPWLTVAAQPTAAVPGAITFAPDGSASGGGILLSEAGRRITVAADWLTGAVHVDAH